MKFKHPLLFLVLIASTYQIRTEDFYAPWTKSKITNNTKYPVVITASYTIPGCKLKTLVGMPCTQKGGSDSCDYYGCGPHGSLKLTLKPGKTITIISDNYADSIEGQVQPGDNMSGNSLKISLPFITDPKTKKQVASNVAPYTLENPSLKNYKVNFDGKNIKIE